MIKDLDLFEVFSGSNAIYEGGCWGPMRFHPRVPQAFGRALRPCWTEMAWASICLSRCFLAEIFRPVTTSTGNLDAAP